MSLNCTEIKNIFVEKQKKGGASHLEDYEYCRLLYENAKGNARRKSLERNSAEHKQESKFNNIHLFLRELEDSGAFEEEEEWGSSSSGSGDYYDLCYSGGAASGLSYEELARARRQRRVHSSHNSDYSFWSLDTSRRSETADTAATEGNYSDLLRLQSRYFYVH